MEFMKIASAIIIGVGMLLDLMMLLMKDWEKFTKWEWVKIFLEPFCFFGGLMICMELWG
jgi:hypothetical protein